MRELYPPIEPYNKGMLQVSNLHRISYEESGNPEGKAVVVLHGGPGGGSQPFYRQYFNPNQWRIRINGELLCLTNAGVVKVHLMRNCKRILLGI